MDINVNGNNSYYVNPNNRTLTRNIKNTSLSDKSDYELFQKKLRPVDDLELILKSPIKLANRTSVNRAANSVILSEGASITVAEGFVLTVKRSGVEVSGGNIDNEKARQNAIDMGGALATLLRNASGMLKNVGTNTQAIDKWNLNISKVLRYFGIDTNKDFYVNGMKYMRDGDGRIVSQAKIDAALEYERTKSTNRTFKFADDKTKKIIYHMSDYYLKNVPDSVSNAWRKTLEETGVNPFPEGYTSTLQQISMEQDFLTGGNDDIFGHTVESSIEAVEKILERIDGSIDSSRNMEYLNDEKTFYSTLLDEIRRNKDFK